MEKQGLEFLTIARAIPVGSRNIERMRQEIHSTVTAVLGLVDKPSTMPNNYRIETFAGHEWRIGLATFGQRLVVEYGYFKDLVPHKSLYNSLQVARGEMTIPHDDVPRIYEMLGYFIKMMYPHFPELPDRLQPLIQAAGANPELFR